jgi:hypothetical protein
LQSSFANSVLTSVMLVLRNVKDTMLIIASNVRKHAAAVLKNARGWLALINESHQFYFSYIIPIQQAIFAICKRIEPLALVISHKSCANPFSFCLSFLFYLDHIFCTINYFFI